MKYIDADKLKAQIKGLQCEQWYDTGEAERAYQFAIKDILAFIDSLQQEQPDNEDIDKVAQELYEHLYELKRRNNVPTNLYDKQEIIDLWKAGIEYGRNHPNQDQPDTCIFGNTPSESSCNFCGVECALREPKQTGTTSAGLSSKDEAVGLAIMAYLDTKVKNDNAKVCGVSLKVAREWIREKIAKANKQEQPEVDFEKEWKSYMESRKDDLSGSAVTVNMKDLARHFYELGLNARKEE